MKRTESRTIRQDQDAVDKYPIEITIDFTDATPDQLAEWAFSNRWIATQNMLRSNWDEDTIQGYSDNGLTVKATDASKKPPEDPFTTVKRMVATGQITKEEAIRRLTE